MTGVTVYTKDGFKVDYYAHAIGWVIQDGTLHAVVYTHNGDEPWLVPANQVSIKV